MEVPELHWEYSENATEFAVHEKDAELSGSVFPSLAIASFSH